MHALYDTAGTFLAALTRHTEVPEVQEPQSSLVADLVFLESAPVNVLLVAGVTCVVWRFCARKKAAARQARFTGDICELAYRRLWLKQGEATEALGIGDERCAKTMSLKRRMLKEEEEEVDVRGAAAENAESKGETRGPPSPQLVQCHRCKKLKRARSGKQGIDEEGDGHPAAEGAKHKVNEEEDDKVNLPKQLQKTIQDVAVIDSVSHLRADNEYKLVFEEYSVGPLLGKGGFGMVRAGTSKESSKPVAIKFVQLPTKNEWIHLPGEATKVPLEIGLMLLVSSDPAHPGVIQLLDSFCWSSKVVLVMELLESSMSLTDYMLKQGGCLMERQANLIFSVVVNSVQYIHSKGVFHRDIKPDNILIQLSTGQVKLIDFGCGALLREEEYTSYAGTLLYAPPEWFTLKRYRAEPATVWSLGVTLFELVYGNVPFLQEEDVVKGKVTFRSGVSTECQDLIQHCLHVQPTERIMLDYLEFHRWMT